MTTRKPAHMKSPRTGAGRELLALVAADGSVFRYEVEPAIHDIEREATLAVLHRLKVRVDRERPMSTADDLFTPCATCDHLGWSHDNWQSCAECNCENWSRVSPANREPNQEAVL